MNLCNSFDAHYSSLKHPSQRAHLEWCRLTQARLEAKPHTNFGHRNILRSSKTVHVLLPVEAMQAESRRSLLQHALGRLGNQTFDWRNHGDVEENPQSWCYQLRQKKRNALMDISHQHLRLMLISTSTSRKSARDSSPKPETPSLPYDHLDLGGEWKNESKKFGKMNSFLNYFKFRYCKYK